MKKPALFCITLVLLLCFFLLDCCSLFPECSARIRIYNELGTDLFVTIDDEEQIIPGWGSCEELIEEDIYMTVPCSALWDLGWSKPDGISCWGEEEQKPEPQCEEQTYSIVLEGVDGLDRFITVHDGDVITLTVYGGGWK